MYFSQPPYFVNHLLTAGTKYGGLTKVNNLGNSYCIFLTKIFTFEKEKHKVEDAVGALKATRTILDEREMEIKRIQKAMNRTIMFFFIQLYINEKGLKTMNCSR